MKTILALLFLALASWGCTSCDTAEAQARASDDAEPVLVQFSRDAGLSGWAVEDDAVMGGRSRGALALDEAGNAVFTGTVSLENDGGFTSIQRDFVPAVDVVPYRALVLGLRGDGKRYQVRVDSEANARHSYAADFQTSGEWETVEIPFGDLQAIRHGDRLDLPPYPGRSLARVQILVGNGVAETFRLEIDRVWLK